MKTMSYEFFAFMEVTDTLADNLSPGLTDAMPGSGSEANYESAINKSKNSVRLISYHPLSNISGYITSAVGMTGNKRIRCC